MGKIVNLAIQVLPSGKQENIYPIVDKAIEVIQKSGVNYTVCPFETVMEGEYEQLMKIVQEVQQACFNAGADNLITNIKIQQSKNKNVFINDKIGKYL